MEDEASLVATPRSLLDALERAYMVHKDRLLTFATAIIGDRAAAEDALHDVFVGLARDGRMLPTGNSLGAFFTVAVRNRAISALRVRKSEEALAQGRGNASGGHYPPPSEAALRSEEDALIVELASALPEDLKNAVALRVWGEHSFKEIAKAEGVSESTAHARYSEGVRRLRQEFARRTGHE